MDKKKKDVDAIKVSPKGYDPKKYIDTEPTYNANNMSEQKSNTVVMTFGRFSPPTIGHEKLVNKVQDEAKKRRADALVYASHTQDKKKNPLSYQDKISFLKTAFGSVIKNSNAKTIIDIAKELAEKYDNLVLIVGQDRVSDFDKLLNSYNGKEYNFKSIEVVSAGERDPDADEVSSMSASKLRSFAAAKDAESFKKGLPKKLQSHSAEVYNAVLKGMKLMEDLEDEDGTLEEKVVPLTYTQRLKRSMVMKRYHGKIQAARERARKRRASPEKLRDRSRKKALILLRSRLSKSKSYAEMTPSEKVSLDQRLSRIPQAVINRIAMKQLPVVKKAESERISSLNRPKNEDVNIDERFETFIENFTQESSINEDYYAGLSKSTAAKRKAHFKKGAAMSDENPAAYTPAPGDAQAKTVPSVHTKRYHQLFKKEGTVNTDRRFKIYKPKKNIFESLDEYVNDINDLIESVDTLFEEPSEGLKKKAEETGISYGILKKVYDRGVAAWRTGHRPGTNPSQWGFARVNSFATKGKGTWGKADSDLAAKVRKEEVEVDEACWTGYKQLGTKKKGDRIVPNCVKEDLDEGQALDMTKTTIEREKEADKIKHKSMLDNARRTDSRRKSLKTESSEVIKKIIEREKKHKSIAKALKSFSDVAKDADIKDHAYHAAKIVKSHNVSMTADELVKLYNRVKNAKDYERSYNVFDAWESVDKNDPKNREYGTDSLVKILKSDTPGEDLDEAKGRFIPPIKHSPSTVKDFVEPLTPDFSVVMSKHNKHHLGVGLNLKQMVKHALVDKDVDNDGDVDAADKKVVGDGELVADPSFDKTKTPGEATSKMKKKYEKEMQHSKVGVAFESVDEAFGRSFGSWSDEMNSASKKANADAEEKSKKRGPVTSDTLKDINNKLGNNKKNSSVTKEEAELDNKFEAFIEAKARGFEGKMIDVPNVNVRMMDGKIKSLPSGKSSSSDGGDGE